MKHLIALSLATSLGLATASECDCQKVVSSCMGAIEFVKGYGSAPSFGAEFIVHSSERRCSKVEYFIDNTPHQTILVNRRQEAESTFGTKPIAAQNITYKSCSVCAADAKGSAPSIAGTFDSREATVSLAGEWVMAVSCDWKMPFQQSERYPFTLSEVEGGAYTASGSIGNGLIQSGTIRGVDVQITTKHWSNIARYTGRISGAASMSGTMTQDANSSVCQWDARKS